MIEQNLVKTSQKQSLIAIAFAAFCSVFLGACSNAHNTQANQPDDATSLSIQQSLEKSYASFFQIGAAVNRDHLLNNNTRGAALIKQHYNVLTAENDMKWEHIQATENEFNFEGADALVRFAQKEKKQLIGHVLVWHSQTPDWVFEDEHGQPASRDLLLTRMKKHIFALAGRYKDDIKGWDVVNEALNEDGTLRESKWLKIIGDDYIEKAFEFASEAAPNAKLYYNDYNMFKASKMSGALKIASKLRKKGIRIDGIGIQAHYPIPVPLDELEISIQRVAEAGLTVMITELDLTVLKFPDEENMGADVSLSFELKGEYNPYANGISEASSAALGKNYINLFSLFLKYHQHIDRVTLWGVSDQNSWRNNWPMRGRTDYPLPFSREYEPKWFVDELINLPKITPVQSLTAVN